MAWSYITGHLELQTNANLGGRFDEVMEAIPSLEYLDISDTDLEGTIPSETTMSDLRVFKAWNTKKLSGSIPTKIGGWKKLGTIIVLGLLANFNV
jgi:hypothetical protein